MARIVMRACRNPACTKGEFPSSTARAAYCSPACRLIHHRQQKKEQQTQIEVTSMSNTPMQHIFSESEYQALCGGAKIAYQAHIEVPHSGLTGAIVEFRPKTLAEALEVFHELRTAGWRLMETTTHLEGVRLFEAPLASFVSLYMCKPVRQQEADLEVINAQVKADYEKELESRLETETERQVQMMLAKQDRDDQLAAEQQRLDREQSARDELAASREKLREQLIGSGKLNADGSTA